MKSEEVKVVVKDLYKKYGDELFLDKARLKAYLSAHLAAHPLEKNLICNAIDCDICIGLVHGKDSVNDMNRYVRLMSETFGTELNCKERYRFARVSSG